jgi:hypothetical protein
MPLASRRLAHWFPRSSPGRIRLFRAYASVRRSSKHGTIESGRDAVEVVRIVRIEEE